MNPSNIRCCRNCEFYEEGECKDFDGEYFLWIISENEVCPDFLQKRVSGYSFKEIINHLENT